MKKKPALTSRSVAFTSIIIALLVGTYGFYIHLSFSGTPPNPFFEFIDQYYANISSEIIGISFVVLVIEKMQEEERKRQEKLNIEAIKDQEVEENKKSQIELLTKLMNRPENEIACKAAVELRVRELHRDTLMKNRSFRQANLSNADLSDFVFEECDFRNAILQGAHFERAKLINANFSGADMTGSHLDNVTAYRAKFVGTNLSNAHLNSGLFLNAIFYIDDKKRGADEFDLDVLLDQLSPRTSYGCFANLSGADRDRANLENARYTDEQLNSAIVTNRIVRKNESMADPEVAKRFNP